MKTDTTLLSSSWYGVGGAPTKRFPSFFSKLTAKHGIKTVVNIFAFNSCDNVGLLKFSTN